MKPDLTALPTDLQESARVDEVGEVSWPVASAERVVNALADSGCVILGLDVRDFAADGTREVAWSALAREHVGDIEVARSEALGALSRGPLPGDWVLITWEPLRT